jgi:hypothetical protein
MTAEGPSDRNRQDEVWLREQILLEQTRYNDIWRIRRLEELLALPSEERSRAVAEERARCGTPKEEAERYETARSSYLRWSLPLGMLSVFTTTLVARGVLPAVLGLALMAAGVWVFWPSRKKT